MMSIKNKFVLTVGVWLIIAAPLPAIGQSANPLRQGEQQTILPVDHQVRTSNYYADVRQNARSANAAIGQIEQPLPIQSQVQQAEYRYRPSNAPTRDENVSLAAFEEIPKSDEPSLVSGRARVLGSTIDEGWQDPKQIVDLIMKISLNLVFVLCFAFGVLLIARRWTKPKLIDGQVERARGDSLSILQTLQIDARISIRLVQWRSNRFLVACDQNGIQSVNPLNATFDQTLKELDQDEASDEQLIKKLLAGLDLSKS